MENPPPNPQYPVTQWLQDSRVLISQVAELPIEARTEAFQSYYDSKYPDDPYSFENQFRIIESFNYLMEHYSEFVIENLIINRKVSEHLLTALYRVFSILDPENPPSEIPVTTVVTLAEGQRDKNEPE